MWLLLLLLPLLGASAHVETITSRNVDESPWITLDDIIVQATEPGFPSIGHDWTLSFQCRATPDPPTYCEPTPTSPLPCTTTPWARLEAGECLLRTQHRQGVVPQPYPWDYPETIASVPGGTKTAAPTLTKVLGLPQMGPYRTSLVLRHILGGDPALDTVFRPPAPPARAMRRVDHVATWPAHTVMGWWQTWCPVWSSAGQLRVSSRYMERYYVVDTRAWNCDDVVHGPKDTHPGTMLYRLLAKVYHDADRRGFV